MGGLLYHRLVFSPKPSERTIVDLRERLPLPWVSMTRLNSANLRAYISEPLTDVEPDPRPLYERAADVLEQAGFVVYLPHRATDPKAHPDVSPADVYVRDRREVLSSDLVVVFALPPSLGVGMEIQLAAEAFIPILLLQPTGRTVSRMPRGAPTKLHGPIAYADTEDLASRLSAALPSIVEDLRRRRAVALQFKGSRLRSLRERAGMSRPHLAALMGTRQEWIRAVEEDETGRIANVSDAFLGAASAALGVSREEVLGLTPASTPLIESLHDYARAKRLSFVSVERLALTARGLRAEQRLSPDEWDSLRRAPARARQKLLEQLAFEFGAD